MSKKLIEQQALTRDYLLAQGLSGEMDTIYVEPAAFHDLVGLSDCAWFFADVSIVLDSLGSDDSAFDNVLYGLLFDGPGPVILNAEANAKVLSPQNVFIAWNSSLPVSRAIRASLPLLKEVTITCFDPDPSRYADGQNPGSDLATWLSHHGVNVTVQEYAKGRQNIGDALMMRAKETTADLVVMGASGRSRWNESIFGGTTETMITQRDLPVLLAI